MSLVILEIARCSGPIIQWHSTLSYHYQRKCSIWNYLFGKVNGANVFPFKAQLFTILTIYLNCVKMLPAVIRAQLNYIKVDSCAVKPSVCLYRSHTHFF